MRTLGHLGLAALLVTAVLSGCSDKQEATAPPAALRPEPDP